MRRPVPGFTAALLALAVLGHPACRITDTRPFPAFAGPERAKTASPAEVLIDAQILVNTLDGSERCGCRTTSVVEVGKLHTLWATFGEARPQASGEWTAGARSARCKDGPFVAVRDDFLRFVGVPYLIVHASTTVGGNPSETLELAVSLRFETLAGFDERRRPVYTKRTDRRNVLLQDGGNVMLPLALEDSTATKAFAIHEVLLRLGAETVEREPTRSYGTVEVSSDMAGADVLLNGAFAERITDGQPTVVQNVPAGEAQLTVRDLSGREVSKTVAVEPNQMTQVTLRVLPEAAGADSHGLLPLGKNPQGHREFWRAKDGALVVRIPAGDFVMGSAQGESNSSAHPQRRAELATFAIDKTEVTWRQYRRFTEATGHPLPPTPLWGTGDDLPVSNVVWDEAKAYCEWVGGRLPHEAEWEKAARGTDGRRYPWGEAWDPLRCNSWERGPKRPQRVGAYPHGASPYGVLDMAGNMWEWCADAFGKRSDSEHPVAHAGTEPVMRRRVLRGGCWITQPLWVRTTYRHATSPSSRSVHNGFRCVQDDPE